MKWPPVKFELDTVVYPKLSPERENGRIVTGYLVRGRAPVVYLVSDADGEEKERLESELTDEVNYQFNVDHEGGEGGGGGK